MSYECAECERDLRGGHDPSCSRYVPPRQTDADDLSELGALSADERDQLATDLQRGQDLTRDRAHVTDGSPCWCGPTTIGPDGSSGELDANPVSTSTSASTTGPGMTIVNATGRRVEFRVTAIPDADDFDTTNGINVTTGLSLHTPIVNAEGGGNVDPWDVDRGPLRPLNDQVFLVRVQPPDRTASGLAIPESAQSKGCECRVLCAGPGAKHARTGERIPMSVAAEDRVVIGKWQGNEVAVPDYVRAWWNIDDREPVIVVRETEILAVLGK